MTETEDLYNKLDREARAGGYLLNPEKEDTMMLADGLLTNIKRFGYASCPCRVGTGKKSEDNDIICPCDYRDADLSEHGACYCALYVTTEWIENKDHRHVVPERRPPPSARTAAAARPDSTSTGQGRKGRLPVWRCKVCGYLCAREHPPDMCPVCKVPGDRFEEFTGAFADSPKYPVWRCKVCGYLCAREHPPDVCPVCKVSGDRFESFI